MSATTEVASLSWIFLPMVGARELVRAKSKCPNSLYGHYPHALIINSWGSFAAPPCSADVAPASGDGVINVSDLLMVVNDWGFNLQQPSC
jgi:hypothetical protein